MKKAFILSTLFLVALLPLALSFGQQQGGDFSKVPETSVVVCPFPQDSISVFLKKVFVDVLRYIALFILIVGFILIGYGGFRYIISRKFDEAKNKIVTGVGGVIIAFLAYGLSILIRKWLEGRGEV